MEGYIFEFRTRVLDKFFRMTKKLDWYLGETYINIYQLSIMTKTQAVFSDPDMPIIIPGTGVGRP